MKEVKNMTLKKIFEITNVMFREGDILDFCSDEETIKGYFEIYNKNNFRSLEAYLIQHEKKIDKEKLVFRLYLNYKNNLEAIKDQLANIKEDWERIRTLIQQQEVQENKMKATAKLGRNMDTYQAEVEFENSRARCEILSSKEEFKNQRLSEKRKLERWKRMDEIAEGEENATIYILQPLILSDLGSILPDFEIGLKLREVILANAVLTEKQMTLQELEAIRDSDFEKYIDLTDNAGPEAYLPELRKELIKNIRFVDIDKLLLICAYRFEEYIEEVECNETAQKMTKFYMEFILNNIENKNAKFKEMLDDRETYKPTQVEYSFQDITKCIERFIGDTYIPKSKIEQARQDLLDGSITLNNLETPIINLIDLNEDEIARIMYYGEENFVYGIEKLKYDEKQVVNSLKEHPETMCVDLLTYLYSTEKIAANSMVQLYTEQVINAEFFKEFSKENDVSSEINLQRINEQYIQVKTQQDSSEEGIQKLQGMIELYKILNLEEKSEEELQEASDNLMYELAENFEDEEDILFYYQEGLIILNTVAEWGGDSLIERLYDESKITFQDIENLYNNKKINQQLIEQIVLENQDIDYKELMRYIYSGYVSENKIIDFYMQGKIFDIDLEEITRQGKISILSFKEATSKRTKEELEKAAQIKLEPTLINIPDKKIHINILEENTPNDYPTSSKTKTLIDPNARYELLELLGAKKANAIIPDEDNAFYNYEFFVIPNKEGELDINSVVIAERFYKDKEYKDEFSVDNATYFFQYKDLMVNSNLKKKEISQDKENIVFTANHRAGSWAVSVLYKIAQTMASSNFKEYKKGDQRAGRVIDELLKIYSQEQLKKILDMTRRIDDTNEFIYEEVNSTYEKTNKSDDEVEL